jgi:hypothetical protein
MNKGDLEQLCDDLELETDPDDYEKVKDLKAAMIAEMFNDNGTPEDASSDKTGKAEPELEKETPSEKKKPAEKKVPAKPKSKDKKGELKEFSKTHYGCAGDIIKENAGESIKIVKLVEMINTAHKKVSGRDTTLDSTRRMVESFVHFCVQVGLATTDGITLNIL